MSVPVGTLCVAQGSGGTDLGDILYLVLFLVLPALSGLGQWIRKRSRKNKLETELEDIFVEVDEAEDSAEGARGPRAGAPPIKPRQPEPQRPQPQRPEPRPAPRPRPETMRPETMRPEPHRPQPARPLPEAPPARPATPARSRLTPAPRHQPAATIGVGPPRARPRPMQPSRRPEEVDTYQPHDFSSSEEIVPDAVGPALNLAGIVADARSLRQAVILAELLGSPLALRRPGQGPFHPRVDES